MSERGSLMQRGHGAGAGGRGLGLCIRSILGGSGTSLSLGQMAHTCPNGLWAAAFWQPGSPQLPACYWPWLSFIFSKRSRSGNWALAKQGLLGSDSELRQPVFGSSRHLPLAG